MMNSKQQKEQDLYLQQLLGAKAVVGYYAATFATPAGNSALGRKQQTAVMPVSSRKAALEAC